MNNLEWTEAECEQPSAHRRGERLADGSEVSLDYAIVIGRQAVEGTADELLSMLAQAAERLEECRATVEPEKVLAALRADCGYSDGADDVDYEVNDSVDALIDYKDALEGLVGQLIEGKGVQ